MRKNYVLSAGTLALLCGAAAMAAPPTAQLEVSGMLTVPGCTVIAGSNDGTYDYGAVSPTMIKPGTTHTALDPLTETWTVDCDAPTYLTYTLIDNRATSVSQDAIHNFGLGLVNDTGKIGYYKVAMKNPRIDDADAKIIYYNEGGSIGYIGTTGDLAKTITFSWSTDSGSQGSIRPGKRFAIDYAVQAHLGGTTTMNGAITDTVPLDGSMTLRYAFGL